MPQFQFDTQTDVRVDAVVAGAAWTESQTGTKGILFRFEFERPAENPFGNGQTEIGTTVWITPKSADMATKQLKDLGFDADTAGAEDCRKFRDDPGALFVGAKCTLVCAIEKANQYHKNDLWKTKFINRRGGGVVSVSDADPLAILRGRKKPDGQSDLPLAEGAGTAAPPPQAVVATKAPEYDDDVPF